MQVADTGSGIDPNDIDDAATQQFAVGIGEQGFDLPVFDAEWDN